MGSFKYCCEKQTCKHSLQVDISQTGGGSLCDDVGNLPKVAPCTPGPFQLVTGDCSTVSSDTLTHPTLMQSCTAASETVTAWAAPPTGGLTRLERVYEHQTGDNILGGHNNRIPVAEMTPLVVPLPAAPVGSVQFVVVDWGEDNSLGTTTSATLAGTDRSNLTKIAEMPNRWPTWERGETVWAADVVGAAAGSVNITFDGLNDGDGDGNLDGVYTVTVYTAEAASDLTVTDFGTPVLHQVPFVPGGRPTAENDTVTTDTSTAVNDCGAVYFGNGRHVRDLDRDRSTLKATDWVTVDPAVVEVTDLSTFDFVGSCQMGISAGLIPAGVSTNFGWTTNQNGAAYGNPAHWFEIPLTACSAGGGVVVTAGCVISQTLECDTPHMKTVEVQSSINYSIATGGSYTVTPLVDGRLLNHLTVTLHAGAGSQMLAFTDTNTDTEFGGLSPIDTTVKWQLVQVTGDPADTITIGDTRTVAKLEAI